MNERLKKLMESEGLTAVKFAEIMEVQPSGISHLLSGRNMPNFDFISKLLLRFPQVNPDWIINAKGDMYKRNELTDLQPGADDTNVISDKLPECTTVIDVRGTSVTPISPELNFATKELQQYGEDSYSSDSKPLIPAEIRAEPRFTDVNTNQGSDINMQAESPSIEPQHTEHATDDKQPNVAHINKPISRVIVIYGDGTFDDYIK